jgi:hypothetical protein
MDEEKRKRMLEKGEEEIRVRRAGMLQSLSFRIVRAKTPFGQVPYMLVEKQVDLPELLRVCEEYGLPIEAPNGKIFPRGKMEKDFAGL